jgi:hypothetical protein
MGSKRRNCLALADQVHELKGHQPSVIRIKSLLE